MTKCKEPGCNAPDTKCSFGETHLSDCKYWPSDSNSEENIVIDDESEVLLPWTSMALGLTDVEFISGCSKPKIIGVIGAENAGKTSMLAAWYLLMSKGGLSQIEKRFAGSYSLIGWEAIANNLRWEPGRPLCFPPHTPSSFRRSPGLLHTAIYSQAEDIIQHYLFADSPGEWFGKWAVNTESPEAEGASWLVNNANVLLLIADRDAISKSGRARSDFKLLTRRLNVESKGRPIALVWTKADIIEDETVIDGIRDFVLSILPQINEFHIQVQINSESDTDNIAENGLLILLKWILKQNSLKVSLPEYDYVGPDPFFMIQHKDVT